MNESEHDSYWRKTHADQPYARKEYTYENYAPAYRLGAEAYEKYGERGFDDSEEDIARDYEKTVGDEGLPWDHARHAVQAVWSKLSNDVTPGDRDRGIRSGM